MPCIRLRARKPSSQANSVRALLHRTNASPFRPLSRELQNGIGAADSVGIGMRQERAKSVRCAIVGSLFTARSYRVLMSTMDMRTCMYSICYASVYVCINPIGAQFLVCTLIGWSLFLPISLIWTTQCCCMVLLQHKLGYRHHITSAYAKRFGNLNIWQRPSPILGDHV